MVKSEITCIECHDKIGKYLTEEHMNDFLTEIVLTEYGLSEASDLVKMGKFDNYEKPLKEAKEYILKRAINKLKGD